MFWPSPAVAHPVALDGLGQDDRRLAVVGAGGGVGGVDLLRVVAAAVERPDLLVAHVLDQLAQLGVGAEEVLADEGAVARLVGLVVAVEGLLHALQEQALVVGGEQRVPARAPDDLETFQPAPRKIVSSSWMILPLPRTGPSSRCRLQLTTKTRLSSCSRPARRDRAERLGLVGLAVAEERPHLAAARVHDPAALQVLHEAGLVDGHDRAQAHRHGRELPQLGHEPRVRIRGQRRRSS